MGLFDYIRCEYPLPDGFDGDVEYQTKDTPNQYLDRYTIAEDGRLLDPDGRAIAFHGDVEFYASNWSGSWGKYFTTTNDEEPWSRGYVARFTNDRVERIITGGSDTEEWVRDRVHVTRAELNRLLDERRATPTEGVTHGDDD